MLKFLDKILLDLHLEFTLLRTSKKYYSKRNSEKQ